jgi:hypothetical protein
VKTLLTTTGLAFSLLALLPHCVTDDSEVGGRDSGGTGDIGDDQGFSLTDADPTAEMFSVSPSSLDFADIEDGDTDFQTITVTNEGALTLELLELSLLDTDNTVRFANLFLQEVGRTYHWADIDGDGHLFEVRDNPIRVEPSQSFEILLHYRPDGGTWECLDPAPAPCGFLVVHSEQISRSVPIILPRE